MGGTSTAEQPRNEILAPHGDGIEGSTEVNINVLKILGGGSLMIVLVVGTGAVIACWWAKKKFGKRVGVRQAKRIELQDKGEAPLDAEQATHHRAMAARCNYLSLDRPDLGYATKELCKECPQPTAQSAIRLKRVVR